MNPIVDFHVDVKEGTITIYDGSSDILRTATLQNYTTTLKNSLQQEQTNEQLNADPNLLQQQRIFYFY